MMNRAKCIVGLAALLTGCGDHSSQEERLVQRDSSRIRIIALPPPSADAEEWKLSSVPALEIGSGTADEAAFGYISGAVRFDNGEVAVLDRQAAEIRVFDSEGRYLRIGRKGAGAW
jgi:hypothetical protein